MDSSTVLALFERHGALLKGHFALSSGFHSTDYVQSGLVLGDPPVAEGLAAALAEQCRSQIGFDRVDCVIGPALGGVVLAFLIARHLGARAIFAERHQGIMSLTRGLDIRPGETVLVVEDVVITGGTVSELLDLIAERRGNVVGVASLLDRSTGPVVSGIPFVALARLETAVYPPAACPDCARQEPLVRPRYGRV